MVRQGDDEHERFSVRNRFALIRLQQKQFRYLAYRPSSCVSQHLDPELHRLGLLACLLRDLFILSSQLLQIDSHLMDCPGESALAHRVFRCHRRVEPRFNGSSQHRLFV
jgi:hypothetical protein